MKQTLRQEPFKIAVMGLGNLMRTDDAVGMLMLSSLRTDARSTPEIQWIEGGTLGLDLLGSMHDVTHLIALDAIDIGVVPGTLVRFEQEQLHQVPISKSVHLLGLSDLLGALSLMDAAPAEVVLLGIQPQYTGWGTELTAAVREAQAGLAHAVFEQVALWSHMRHAARPLTESVTAVS